MDEKENEYETELPTTERVERLATSAGKKHAVDIGEHDDMEATLDTGPGQEDGNNSSELLLMENSQNASDGLILDDTNCIPDPAENSCSVAENVSAMLSPSGDESSGFSLIQSTTEQDADSSVDNAVDVVENDAEKVLVVNDNRRDAASVKTSDMSLSFEILSRDNASFKQDQSSLHPVEELADVDEAQTSTADVNSSTVMSSFAESCDARSTEAAELTADVTSQPECKGKHIFRFRFFIVCFLANLFCSRPLPVSLLLLQ